MSLQTNEIPEDRENYNNGAVTAFAYMALFGADPELTWDAAVAMEVTFKDADESDMSMIHKAFGPKWLTHNTKTGRQR